MPCCAPPCNTTEPMSSLTRTFLAAASVPDVAWLQAPLSRAMRVSWATASGASTANTQSNLTNCGEHFKINHLSFCKTSINFGQLRQHGAGLRLDVLALVLGRQCHQHAAHAAIGLHRLDQPQRFGADAGIRIVDQSFQHYVAYPH